MLKTTRFILAAALVGAFYSSPLSAQKQETKADCVDCGSGCTSPDCAQKCAEGQKTASQTMAKQNSAKIKAVSIQAASAKKAKAAKILPISIQGMTCKACVAKVTKALKAAGAENVKVCLKSGLASVVPQKGSKAADLVKAVSAAGFKAKRVPVTAYALSVKGMTCGACASKVEKALSAFPAAYKVKVDLKKGRAVVMGPKGYLKPETLTKAVNALKFKASPLPTTMHCLDLNALGNPKDLASQLKAMEGVITAKVFAKMKHACVLTIDDKATNAAFTKTFGKAVRPACNAKSAKSACSAKSAKSSCGDCPSGKSECLDCDKGTKVKGSCNNKN